MDRPFRKIITRYVRFRAATCRLFRCIPQVFTRAATATLNPTGDNNSILVTTKTTGTVGNSLTAAITISSGGTSLSVSETDGDVVIASGNKRRMIVTGTLTPNATGELFPAGLDSFGIMTYQSSGAFVTYPTVTLSWFDPLDLGTGYYKLVYYTDSETDVEWRSGFSSQGTWGDPSEATGWAPAGSPTGTPVVTAATATVNQALALSQTDLSVTLTNATGSDGSGVLAAVSATPLTGGI